MCLWPSVTYVIEAYIAKYTDDHLQYAHTKLWNGLLPEHDWWYHARHLSHCIHKIVVLVVVSFSCKQWAQNLGSVNLNSFLILCVCFDDGLHSPVCFGLCFFVDVNCCLSWFLFAA